MPTLNKRDFYNKLEVDNKLKDLLKNLRGYSVDKTKDYYNKFEIDNKLNSVLSNISNKYITPNIPTLDSEILSGRYDCSDLNYIKPTYIKLINLGNIPGKNTTTYLSKEYNIKNYIENLEKCISASSNTYGYVLNTKNGSKHILNSSLYSRSTETHSLTFYNLVWSTDTSIIFYWNQFTVESFIDLYLQIEYTKITDEPVSIEDTTPGGEGFDPDLYYTKEEVQELISNISINLSDYYTKEDINNNYYDKTNINDNYYNKTYIDTNYYTKEDIDNNSNIQYNPVINYIGKYDGFNKYFQSIPLQNTILNGNLNTDNEIIFNLEDYDKKNTIVDILDYNLCIRKQLGTGDNKDSNIKLSNFYICYDGSVFKLYFTRKVDSSNVDSIVFSVMGQGDNFNFYYLTNLQVEYTGIPKINYTGLNPYIMPVDCYITINLINNWTQETTNPHLKIIDYDVKKGDIISLSSNSGPNPIYIYKNNEEIGVANILQPINNLALNIVGSPTSKWDGK